MLICYCSLVIRAYNRVHATWLMVNGYKKFVFIFFNIRPLDYVFFHYILYIVYTNCIHIYINIL